MWPSSWRSLGKVAHRQLKRVYPARRHDDYFEDDDLPLGEVNQPLLPTTPYLLPALPIHKRSFWRSRLSQLFLILCGVVFLVGTPRFVAFLHLYTDPGYADTFNPSYRPNAQDIEHLVPAMDISERAPTMAMLQNDLAARLDSLGMPAYENTITCPSLDSTASISRYGHLASPLRGRVLLALNLYNNGAVLPSVGRSLLKLAAFLGPQNVLVSIFENGSSDNTMLGLAHLAAILTAADVPHTIRSDTHRTVWKDVDRIEQLALYRNTVMEPLYATANLTRRQMSGEVLTGNERPFESVVFINDVYFCPTDALELLHVRATQEAHATCGLDYRWRHNALKGLFGSGPKVRSGCNSPWPWPLSFRLSSFLHPACFRLIHVLTLSISLFLNHNRLRESRLLCIYSFIQSALALSVSSALFPTWIPIHPTPTLSVRPASLPARHCFRLFLFCQFACCSSTTTGWRARSMATHSAPASTSSPRCATASQNSSQTPPTPPCMRAGPPRAPSPCTPAGTA